MNTLQSYFMNHLRPRHIALSRLPSMGDDALVSFRNAHVAVVGCGGLGCPLLVSLASSGIGTLVLIDHDLIEETNLGRQWLYDESDIGKPKVECAARRLRAMDSQLQIITHQERLSGKNALQLLDGADVVVDATDNFATRYCLCDVSYHLSIPMVMGAMHQWQGQVSVFNFKDHKDDAGPNYRDVFPEPPSSELAPDCGIAGTMAPICSIIANVMAQETLLTLLYKPTLSGRLLIFDLKNYETIHFVINKKPLNPLYTGEITLENLIDYDEFCFRTNLSLSMLKECSPTELKEWLDASKDLILVDVREQDESAIVSIGGTLIPLSQFTIRCLEIPKDKEVVVYCRSGVRSANAIRYLEEQHDYTNLVNLKGGILGWISEVDPTLTRY